MIKTSIVTIFRVFCLFSLHSLLVSASYDRILLRDIDSLSFRWGEVTNSRRVPPINRIQCHGTGCYGLEPIHTMRCINRNARTGRNVHWDCTASGLSKGVTLGKVKVICEGYSRPDDEYVLMDSCGTRVELIRTVEDKPYSKDSEGSFASIWFIIALIIIGFIIYSNWVAPPADDRNTGRTPGEGRMPPPPPGFQPQYRPGYDDGFGGYDDGFGGSDCGQTRNRRSATGGLGGAGFWTGLAAGSGLGYLFGARNTGAGYTSSYRTSSVPGSSTMYRRHFDDSSSSSTEQTAFADTEIR